MGSRSFPDSTDRLFRLFALLVDRRVPLPVDKIRETLYSTHNDESFKTAFRRDRQLLESLGIVITQVTHGTASGYLIDASASFISHDMLFTLDESTFAACYAALDFCEGDPLFPLPLELRFARLRLAQAWHESYGDESVPTSTHRQLSKAALTAARQSSHIVRGLVECTQVKLVYRNKSGAITERTVSPYGLSYLGGHFYLIAHDSLRDDIRCFAFERVCDATPTTCSFERPPDFHIHDYVGLPFLLSGEEPIGEVELKIPVEQRYRHSHLTRGKGSIITHEDGSATWCVPYADLDLLMRFVATHGLRFADSSSYEALEFERAINLLLEGLLLEETKR